MIVYYNGQLMEKSKVAISPDDRGFLFADGIYDVIHTYGGRLFKCAEHLERLAFGLRELQITGIHPAELEPVMKQLLELNKLTETETLVYVQITRGAALRSHEFPPAETAPTVYMQVREYAPPRSFQENGASALLVPDQRWARCDLKTIGLLPNTLARQPAKEAGAFEAIFRGNGLLQEGSHSSILFAQKDTLVCPPLTNRVLPSITRNVVLGLAVAESIEVETRGCPEGELFSFDEVLMLGTGVEIVPITAVNGRRIGNGAVGPIARQLQSAFRSLVEQG